MSPVVIGSPSSNFAIYFGNAAYPNGQGVMPWMWLSDQVSWFVREYQVAGDNRQIGVAQLPFRSKGVYLSDDFGGKVIGIPLRYYEAALVKLSTVKAQLSQAGEQYLTFDNKVTGSLARFKGFAQAPQLVKTFDPLLWDVTLEFYLKEPWFRDLAATAIGSQSFNAGTPGSFAVTYAGSVFAEPVYTITVPAQLRAPNQDAYHAQYVSTSVRSSVGRRGATRMVSVQRARSLNGPLAAASPISAITITNTMSGETITVNFASTSSLGLDSTQAWTITVDAGAMTAKDQNGLSYDCTGTDFPKLYPPASQSNPFTVSAVQASAPYTPLTFAGSFQARWEL